MENHTDIETLLTKYFEGKTTPPENEQIYKPQNKMFHFCKTFCSKITLVNTIQNVILNPI